jgi:putative phosphoesterase
MPRSAKRPRSHTTLGVISDTHGLVRPEAVAALRGCDALVHAGDIGKREVLEELRRLAPLTAIRGNVDTWAPPDLPETAVLTIAGVRLYVIHNVNELAVDPRTAGYRAVISGHSHVPKAERVDGVLYLNPGSAGPKRFNLPICVAKLHIDGGSLEPELIDLMR